MTSVQKSWQKKSSWGWRKKKMHIQKTESFHKASAKLWCKRLHWIQRRIREHFDLWTTIHQVEDRRSIKRIHWREVTFGHQQQFGHNRTNNPRHVKCCSHNNVGGKTRWTNFEWFIRNVKNGHPTKGFFCICIVMCWSLYLNSCDSCYNES